MFYLFDSEFGESSRNLFLLSYRPPIICVDAIVIYVDAHGKKEHETIIHDRKTQFVNVPSTDQYRHG